MALSKEKIAKCKEIIEAEGKEEGLSLADFEAIEKDEIFPIAAKIAKEHGKEFFTAYNKILNNFSDIMPESGPLFLIEVEKEGNTIKNISVIKYDNLHVDYSSDEDYFKHVQWILPFAIMPWWKNYQQDMADNNKKKAWETVERASTRLLRTTRTSLTGLVSDFNTAKKGKYPADKIRDLCQKIEADYWPTEFKWCENAQDYRDMYTNPNGPQSCMSHWEKDHQNNKDLFNKGLHPTMFYAALHPHVQGVGLYQKKVLVARTIVYSPKGGKPWAGRIYYSSYEAKNQIIKQLKELNIRVEGESGGGIFDDTVLYDNVFELPGISNGSQMYYPLPYFDNMNRVLYAKKDGNKCLITWRVTNGFQAFEASTKGYFREDELSTMTCMHCGKGFRKGIVTEDGIAFCSMSHAHPHGYFQITRGDGSVVINRPREIGAYLDPLSNGAGYFSNKEAAIRYGAVPVKMDIDEVIENLDDAEYSIHGYVIYSEAEGCNVGLPIQVAERNGARFVRKGGKTIIPTPEPKFQIIKTEFIKPFRISETGKLETL